MKNIIITLFLSSCFFAQNVEDIKQYYNQIYSLEITKLPNGHIASSYFTDELKDSSIFSELVNKNILIFDYIIFHTKSLGDSINTFLLDTTNYRARFADMIIHNSELDSNIFPLVRKYINAQVLSVDPIQFENKEYSKNDIMNIAVRFFFPFSIINNELQSHVCVGINGMEDFPKKGDEILEGFIFQTVFTNLDNENYKIREDFTHAKQKAKTMDLSESEDVLLKRAQGVIWAEMYESISLWEAIVQEYKSKKDILPFIIKGE